MRVLYSAALLAMLGLHGGATFAGSSELLAGDIVTGLFPLAALGTAFLRDDGEGKIEWLRTTAISGALNSGLRVAFNSTGLGNRPNGRSYGFPSGHTSFVFSQAAFLQERYGWRYGAPALALASAVGYVRVHENKHHRRDVIAGGALSYGVALLTVTPEKATHIAPIIGPDWLGIRFERSF